MCGGFSFLRFQWVGHFCFNKTGLFLLDICHGCATVTTVHPLFIEKLNIKRKKRSTRENRYRMNKPASERLSKAAKKLHCFRFSLGNNRRRMATESILLEGNKWHENLSGATTIFSPINKRMKFGVRHQRNLRLITKTK